MRCNHGTEQMGVWKSVCGGCTGDFGDCRASEAQCDVSLRGGARQGTVTLPAEGVQTVAFPASVSLFLTSKAVCTAQILVSQVTVSTSTQTGISMPLI